jgi:hypothetical protein
MSSTCGQMADTDGATGITVPLPGSAVLHVEYFEREDTIIDQCYASMPVFWALSRIDQGILVDDISVVTYRYVSTSIRLQTYRHTGVSAYRAYRYAPPMTGHG